MDNQNHCVSIKQTRLIVNAHEQNLLINSFCNNGYVCLHYRGLCLKSCLPGFPRSHAGECQIEWATLYPAARVCSRNSTIRFEFDTRGRRQRMVVMGLADEHGYDYYEGATGCFRSTFRHKQFSFIVSDEKSMPYIDKG